MYNYKNGPITEAELPGAIDKFYGASNDPYQNDMRSLQWANLISVMRTTGWILGCDDGMPGYWHTTYKFDGQPTSFVMPSNDFNSSMFDIFLFDTDREYDFNYKCPAVDHIRPLLEAFGV